jgi:lipoprotein signal peptidase
MIRVVVPVLCGFVVWLLCLAPAYDATRDGVQAFAIALLLGAGVASLADRFCGWLSRTVIDHEEDVR